MTVFQLLVSPCVAAGVTFCSPERNHPWWSHPCGVHLDTHFLDSVRLARVPSYGRELYIILALLLGCGVIPLGDKVFFTRGEIFMAERGISKDLLESPSLGTLTSLTLSRKRVPKCIPDGWLHQGWFFSGEQQVTPVATQGETSSRKTVNGEMYANLPH